MKCVNTDDFLHRLGIWPGREGANVTYELAQSVARECSVDAVAVVRCADCLYCVKSAAMREAKCFHPDMKGRTVCKDGYCEHGRRR